MTICCDDSTQDASWCPADTDDVMPSVLGLLPPGPAWTAAQVDGTTQNKFWRAFASVLAVAHQRICAFIEEFYCATATESLEQWREEYDVGGECDPWVNNLCAKVAAQGGQTLAYFEQMALDAGWVITTEEIKPYIFAAGCAMAGKPLGVRPKVLVPPDTGGLCECLPASSHGEPELWEWGTDRHEATCRVPGSNLGLGALGSGCCNIAGYHVTPSDTAIDIYNAKFGGDPITHPQSACTGTESYYQFACPPACVPSFKAHAADSTGHFERYTGGAYLWRVIVDLAASANELKNQPQWQHVPFSQAGCMVAGCFQAGQGPSFNPALCFLEDLKPAHTEIIYSTV